MLGETDSGVLDLLQSLLNSNGRLETTLRDVKARLYQLHDKHDRRSFIVDAIGMANAVRRIGRRGYIFFGIEESTKRVIDQSQANVNPGQSGLTLDKLMDINERELIDCLRVHVAPMMDVSLSYGEVQGPENLEAYALSLDPAAAPASPPPRNRGIVAWLEFRRMPSTPVGDKPYTVKQGFQYEITGDGEPSSRMLRSDSAWTRIGASNQDELRPDRHDILVSIDRIPWVDNSSWLAYARRPASPEPQFNAPIDGVYGDFGRTGQGAETGDALALLLRWLADGTNTNLYLHGGIGAGKSSLLQALDSEVRKELERSSSELVLISDEPPSAWIPILASVHHQSFLDATAVADYVLEQANLNGDLSVIYDAASSNPEWRRKLFDSPGHHFLVILDGLDEMEDDGESWSRSLRSVKRFCDAHRGRVRVILSARTKTPLWPDVGAGWRELRLLPLRETSVETSARKLHYPDAVWGVMMATAELREYLTIPLVMDRLFDFCKDVEMTAQRLGEVPQYEVGQLIERVVQAIVEHESRKDPRLHQPEARVHRCDALAMLAWKLDGSQYDAPLEQIEEILGTGEIYRVEQMGFLAPGQSDRTWGFTSLVVKSYFAARHALSLAQSALFNHRTVDWRMELKHAARGADLWPLTSKILFALATNESLVPLLLSFLDEIGQPAAASGLSPS